MKRNREFRICATQLDELAYLLSLMHRGQLFVHGYNKLQIVDDKSCSSIRTAPHKIIYNKYLIIQMCEGTYVSCGFSPLKPRPMM